MALGPAQQAPEGWGPEFSGTVYTAQPGSLYADLEAARRASVRLFVSFTGNEQYLRDANGFNLTKWKARVDRFRGYDLSSYIADGTINGHFILDEPSDAANWNGHVVPQAQIEEMARYSKQIWPTLPAIIRAYPDFLDGSQYPSLDAVRVQYHSRFGDVDAFIDRHLSGARALGLSMVGGLNVIHGGSKNNGMPSYSPGKFSMSPTELRQWGARYLTEDLCGFVLWEHRPDYFSRSDVKAALEELSRVARGRPKRTCRD
jgi:hypothetical protein